MGAYCSPPVLVACSALTSPSRCINAHTLYMCAHIVFSSLLSLSSISKGCRRARRPVDFSRGRPSRGSPPRIFQGGVLVAISDPGTHLELFSGNGQQRCCSKFKVLKELGKEGTCSCRYRHRRHHSLLVAELSCMLLLVSTCWSEWPSDAWLLSCLLPHKTLGEPCRGDAGVLELLCA